MFSRFCSAIILGTNHYIPVGPPIGFGFSVVMMGPDGGHEFHPNVIGCHIRWSDLSSVLDIASDFPDVICSNVVQGPSQDLKSASALFEKRLFLQFQTVGTLVIGVLSSKPNAHRESMTAEQPHKALYRGVGVCVEVELVHDL
jgi:hypothetical protein